MKSLILFGFKSCGKTHFGKLLAQRLNWTFIDTDDLMIKLYQEKNSVREIYESLGEKGFRELEAKVIQTLRPTSPSVIALGGGSILEKNNIAHLQTIGHLIYLKADFSTVHRRILNHQIPSFVDPSNPIDSLLAIYEKRKLLYESIQAPFVNVSLLDERAILEKLHTLATQEHSYYGF